MALDVRATLVEGLERTRCRTGLLLIAALVVVKLASLVAAQTLARSYLAALRAFAASSGSPEPGMPPDALAAAVGPTPFALPLDLGTAVWLALSVAVLAEGVRVAAVRVLATDRTDAIPSGLLWPDLGTATIRGFVAGVVVLLLTAVGAALLVLPGVFLAVSFLFVRQEVAVEGTGILGALSGSWGLASGNRVALLGLAVAVSLVEVAAVLPTALLATASPALAGLAGAAVSAVTTVFAAAVVTRAYVPLREERAERRALLAGPDDGGDWAPP